ncbi:MAG: hypothetical protein AB7H66_03280 [Hyphomonadaceae bacterium]
MKLLPRQLVRGVELAAATFPKTATPMEIALALASPDVGCVPLRRCAKSSRYEALTDGVGSLADPWAMAGCGARDVKRHAAAWVKADAVGITFPAGGPDWVLDPETRTLSEYCT